MSRMTCSATYRTCSSAPTHLQPSTEMPRPLLVAPPSLAWALLDPLTRFSPPNKQMHRRAWTLLPPRSPHRGHRGRRGRRAHPSSAHCDHMRLLPVVEEEGVEEERRGKVDCNLQQPVVVTCPSPGPLMALVATV